MQFFLQKKTALCVELVYKTFLKYFVDYRLNVN